MKFKCPVYFHKHVVWAPKIHSFHWKSLCMCEREREREINRESEVFIITNAKKTNKNPQLTKSH